MLNKVESFNNRLNLAMSIRNIKAVELVEKTGLSKAQISQYTNNVYEAKQKALYLLSQALNVNESWLMGYDVAMERTEKVMPAIKPKKSNTLKAAYDELKDTVTDSDELTAEDKATLLGLIDVSISRIKK